MDITSYSHEQIKGGISKARKRLGETSDNIRLLFAPERIDDSNFDQACDIYSRINMNNYDTVVFVESYDEKLDKKLPMASTSTFETPFGSVRVNDYMRNELCDEDDDFFIHDEAFDKNISLFQQLMFFQTLSDDFSALSIQIADKDPAIIKELAYVLEEIMGPRNALLVFCCELDSKHRQEFEQVQDILEKENRSGLLNYLNSGESNIAGTTSFIAGIMVANEWDLKLNFLNAADGDKGNLLSAYAELERILF